MLKGKPADMPASSSSGFERSAASDRAAATGQSQVVTLVVAWAAVGVPLMWGVIETFHKALALFG
ncbi:MAG TPA: hypothetical protein VG963_32020 [Polyangiaceae bacterium]|nr:hypothetical protein [Polyangiaceae bacterium]